MSFDIEFDYRFDTNGFFDDPERRAAIEAAGEIWEELILDEFEDVPAGVSFTALNPETSQPETIVLDTAIDDLVIFVGSQSIAEVGTIALGGFTGSDAEGDAFGARVSSNFRGQGPVTDFEPWAGTVTFDSDLDFSFSIDDPVPGQIDFISVALHEIGHVLGLGTSPIFREIGIGAQFDGPNALAVNQGNPVPLEADLVHVLDGFNDNTVLLDPQLNPIATSGGRNLPSDIDLALLADIGFEIEGFTAQGSTPAIATDTDEVVFGTILADSVSGFAGNDQLQGNAGNDDLSGNAGDDILFGEVGDDNLSGDAGNDQIQGGPGSDSISGGAGNDSLFGEAGSDTFFIEPNADEDAIGDFVVGEDTIAIAPDFGFADGADVLTAIELTGATTTGGLFTQLDLGLDTTVTIFHEEALTATDFAIAVNEPAPDPEPTPEPAPEPTPSPDPEPVIQNIAPTFTSAVSVLIVEGVTEVLTLTADDQEGDELAFSIVGGADQEAFAIADPLTGALVFQATPDFEIPGDADGNNVFAVEVAVTDGTNEPVVQALAVMVTDDLVDNPEPDTPEPEIPDPIADPDPLAPEIPNLPEEPDTLTNLDIDGVGGLVPSVDILNIFRVLAGAPQAVVVPDGVSQQAVSDAVNALSEMGLDVDGSGDVVAAVDVLNIFRVLAGAPQAVVIPDGIAVSQQDVVNAVSEFLG